MLIIKKEKQLIVAVLKREKSKQKTLMLILKIAVVNSPQMNWIRNHHNLRWDNVLMFQQSNLTVNEVL